VTSRALTRLALFSFLAAAAAIAFAWRDRLDLARLEAVVASAGAFGPLVYIAIYSVATMLFVPGAIFGLVGGALFGPLWGTLLNLVGATLGATAAFVLARYVAAGWVRQRAGGWLERLIAGVEAEGWRFVAFVRLVPLFPFNLSNYALGLTRISLLPYVAASFICMAPGALAYTWLGFAGREAAAGNLAAIRYGLIALALLAAVAFLPRLVRRLRGDGIAQWIEVESLAGRLKEGGLRVIDVRGPHEFSGPLGHIAGAKNLPAGELPNRLVEIEAVKDESIVVVCRTDKRSANAAALLRAAGFRDVHVLRGGMERWNRTGLPVESAAAHTRS
jgi:uncharacterized membrane protein YdjX (TVP38/TMEM64 family)/rhodanese-related sulfurtransferase